MRISTPCPAQKPVFRKRPHANPCQYLFMSFPVGKRLLTRYRLQYICAAAAKSAAGFRTPFNLKAAPHRARAVALAHLSDTRLHCRVSGASMVAQAGQPSGWPVAFRTGSANPVWATTQEIRTSGGSVTRYLKEVVLWLSPLIPAWGFTMLNLSVLPDGDSWDITERCRVLAHSLVNLDSPAARDEVGRLIQAHLEHLAITLQAPIPPNRLNLSLPPDDGLYDNRALDVFELWDHCRALVYVLLETTHPTVKEVMCFILWERLDCLRRALYAPGGRDE